MAVSVIEGTIEEVDEGRSPPLGKATIYKRVTWNPGTQSEYRRFIVDRSTNPYIEPGMTGRFYTCSNFDQRGIYGFRGADGESHFAWPGGGTLLWKIALGTGILWSGLTLATEGDIPILALIIMAVGIVALVVNARNRKAGEELFNADLDG
ncbi:hypothetical protein HFP51_12310 [Parasphingopyxis sp. CP4]|uniref:hypothetical protein n=1 Tax=Parasphingopyxis sp. CP4 TaxID=2724527 RepID=UPI0015A471FD|nr:hypothetical protein [Parasphingopyxis sp. CP4]QLC22899.1 hypothetical protein HFP51_12310 [Parasphingopyxis sp. CP4]